MRDEHTDVTADRAGAELPFDSDIEVDDRGGGRPRAVHHHKRYLALVAAGGTVGTAAREGITLALPRIGDFPLATFLINITGAFLLGLLLEALARGGPDAGARRTLRLLLGTGALGGFTTYSTLATDSALLLRQGDALVALEYALVTLILGALASWTGVLVAATTHRRRSHGGSP